MGKKNITLEEFFDEAKKLTEADPLWKELSDCLYYCSLSAFSADRTSAITYHQFDVVAETRYGANEGILSDIHLIGDCGLQVTGRPIYLATLKTLYSDKSAFLKVACLGNLFCYYANQFVGQNLERFEK